MLSFAFSKPATICWAALGCSILMWQEALAQERGRSEFYSGDMMGSESMGESSSMSMMGRPTKAEADRQRFHHGMQRVVKSLEQAETEEEKKRLLELGRKGLEWRYQSKLDQRKKDLDRLRQELKALEADYDRRVQAMPRVINLQLESLKLAAEGLVPLEGVIGNAPGAGGYGAPGGSDMMMGRYGGESGSGMQAGGGGYGEIGTAPSNQPLQPNEDPFEGLDDKSGGSNEERSPATP